MPKTLLAVDDSVTMRKVIQMTFAGEDIRVVTVATAQECIAAVQREHPDVVLCDASLDGTTGYDLCRKLKDSAPRAIPVVLLTSKQNPFDAARAQAAGADEHIDKPWDTAKTIDLVKKVLSAGKSMAPAAITAAPAAGSTATARAAVFGVGAPTAKPPAGYAAAAAGTSQANLGAVNAPAPHPLVAHAPAPPLGSAPSRGPAAPPPARPMAPLASPPVAPMPAMGKPMAPVASHPPIQPASPLEKTGERRALLKEPTPAVVAPMAPKAAESRPTPIAQTPVAPPVAPAAPAAAAVTANTVNAVSAAVAAPPAPTPPTAAAAVAAPVNGTKALAPELAQKLAGLGLTPAQVDGVLALSRDVIERVVWEVVPVLAETMVREEIARLTREA